MTCTASSQAPYQGRKRNGMTGAAASHSQQSCPLPPTKLLIEPGLHDCNVLGKMILSTDRLLMEVLCCNSLQTACWLFTTSLMPGCEPSGEAMRKDPPPPLFPFACNFAWQAVCCLRLASSALRSSSPSIVRLRPFPIMPKLAHVAPVHIMNALNAMQATLNR